VGDPDDGGWTGTGFHFGGGWVMTNKHVIVDDDKAIETFRVSEAIFEFPGIEKPIPAKRRSFFCTQFENWNEDVGKSTRKDLALMYVPELLNLPKSVLGLYNIYPDTQDEHPAKDERVYLIHYGGNEEEQFSFGQITKIGTRHTEAEFKCYYMHNAYCPDGSSGAPLLWFNRLGHLVLCAVHFVGTEDDSRGVALPYRRHHWIADTMSFAPTIVSNTINSLKTLSEETNSSDLSDSASKHMNEVCKSLSTKAVEKHILVFLDCENLPNDLPNVRSAD
jgi:hypothetical protein